MNDEKTCQVEENKKKLVGEDRFTIIVEESRNILSDTEIDEMVKCYARMLAYEYIADHPESFENTADEPKDVADEEIPVARPIFKGGLCVTIGNIKDGGNNRCVA